MLSKEEYLQCIKVLGEGQVDDIKEILRVMDTSDSSFRRMMDYLASGGVVNMQEATWDLSRPDIYMTTVDLLGRLKGKHPELVGEIDGLMTSLSFSHVYRSPGGASDVAESYMAFSGGLKARDGDGEIVNSDLSPALLDAAATLCNEVADEIGVDMTHLNEHPSSVRRRGNTVSKRDVEADVESFKSEMDDIFATWDGG